MPLPHPKKKGKITIQINNKTEKRIGVELGPGASLVLQLVERRWRVHFPHFGLVIPFAHIWDLCHLLSLWCKARFLGQRDVLGTHWAIIYCPKMKPNGAGNFSFLPGPYSNTRNLGYLVGTLGDML